MFFNISNYIIYIYRPTTGPRQFLANFAAKSSTNKPNLGTNIKVTKIPYLEFCEKLDSIYYSIEKPLQKQKQLLNAPPVIISKKPGFVTITVTDTSGRYLPISKQVPAPQLYVHDDPFTSPFSKPTKQHQGTSHHRDNDKTGYCEICNISFFHGVDIVSNKQKHMQLNVK